MLSWDRNKITDDGWEFEQVNDFSVFSEFDCGDDDLNDFVLNDARRHKDEMIAETYSFRFIEEQGSPTAPVAFVSLSNDTIELTRAQKRKLIHHHVRGYATYPAVKIARLGVHRDLQRRSVGTQLVELIKYLLTTNNRTGCRFLSVDAYTKTEVVNFYIKNDFQFLLENESDKDDSTRTMYFDLKRFRRPE